MSWFVTLSYVAGLVSAGFAVVGTRTSQGAIAWAVSLITFPFFAVPAYWVFGRNRFQGYVRARREQLAALHARLDHVTSGANDDSGIPGVAPGPVRSAELLARMPLTRGNKIELLVDGETTFASIFEGIDRAKDYVLVQFYIVHDDGLGRALKNRLIARAREGVRIMFLYDEVGSFGLASEYVDELVTAGVDVRPFNTRKGSRNRFQLNFRNHRKIVVVDGAACWIGGHNVGDEYLGKDPEVGAWRDTHVKITGPATLAAQLSFVEDWHWASDEQADELVWDPATEAHGDADLVVVPSGPADELETAGLLHLQAISAANRRIWIASPYFVPDESIIAALQLACLRGVDVRILIPDKTDNLVVTLAAHTYVDDVQQCGARFFRHMRGFMHQKVFLIDDVAAVGTANFDNRSFRLNFEVTALGGGDSWIRSVESMLERDFADSREMAAGEFSRMRPWSRLAAKICRLFAPVL